MNLLALETATDTCSVALLRDGHVEVDLALHRPRAHAERLVPMVQEALHLGGLAPADLDAVAVSMGPGSYTGLRIGVSTAKGLCFATSAQLVGVPSLEALAHPAAAFAAEGDLIVAATNSRRHEVYAAAFRLADGVLQAVAEPAALETTDLAGWLPPAPGALWLVGSGAERAAAPLQADGHAPRLLPPTLLPPSAAPVARIGYARVMRGETEDVAAFEPRYLKEFVARRPERSIFERLPF